MPWNPSHVPPHPKILKHKSMQLWVRLTTADFIYLTSFFVCTFMIFLREIHYMSLTINISTLAKSQSADFQAAWTSQSRIILSFSNWKWLWGSESLATIHNPTLIIWWIKSVNTKLLRIVLHIHIQWNFLLLIHLMVSKLVYLHLKDISPCWMRVVLQANIDTDSKQNHCRLLHLEIGK